MHGFGNNWLRQSAWALGIILLVFFNTPCLAQQTPAPQIVEVIGTAQSKNITQARQKAIANSLSTAVEMATADLLPLESLIQNFSTLNEIIFNQTNRYVQHYKVLTETRSEKYYRVIVRASIAVDAIQQHLSTAGILLGSKPLPRILFLMVEQRPSEASPSAWQGGKMATRRTLTEESLVNILKIKGLLEIDRTHLIPALKDVSLACEPDFNNQEAVALGAQFQADMVIVGKSRIAPPTEGGNPTVLEATVNIRALRVDSGVEIASASESIVKTASAVNIGSRAALAEVGTLAGEKLAEQILAEWQKDIKQLMALKIIVSGTGNLANFVIFRRTLNQLPGMKGLQTSEMKPDEVTLLAQYQGRSEDLAAALTTQTFESLQISISEISADLLKIALVPTS